MTEAPVLLVMDCSEAARPRLRGALEAAVRRAGAGGGALHALVFVEDPQGDVVAGLRRVWRGTLEVIPGQRALEQAASIASRELNQFVSDLRTRLQELTARIAGRRWAARFGTLWWYTKVSEKNGPFDPIWSECARLGAIRERLQAVAYRRCVFVGHARGVGLVRQLCRANRVEYSGVTIERTPRRVWRWLALRAAAGMGLVACVGLTKWRYRRARESLPGVDGRARNGVLAFSWPEFWRHRFGAWEDVYYGRTVQEVAQRHAQPPLVVLGLYGRAYLPWRILRAQLRSLRRVEWRAVRWVPLEAFGSARQIATRYLRVSDLIAFVRVRCTADYRRLWRWRDVDLTDVFSEMMWESVLVRWPYLESQEEMAAAVVGAVQPSAALLYSFEYLGGRALLRGVRRVAGVRVIAMQHGPMAPMKWMYSGTAEELRPTRFGGASWPEADRYGLDGPLSVRLLAARGLPPERLEVTGAARLDPVWRAAQAAQGVSRCERRPVRLLVAPGLHDTAFVVRFVLEAFAGDARVWLTIKPHPKISPQYVEALVASTAARRGQPSMNVEIVRQGEIYDWLARADLLIGTYSSTAIEAVAFNVPVVILASQRQLDLSPFFGVQPSVLTAGDVHALQAQVSRLIEDRAMREAYLGQLRGVLEDVFGVLDSRACERMAALCEQAASGRSGAAGTEDEPREPVPAGSGDGMAPVSRAGG